MASKGYFAIVERQKSRMFDETSWPKFCGKNLKIFNTILTNTLEIEEVYQSDIINNWKVTFFKDSHFSQTLEFKVVQDDFFDKKPDVVALSGVDRDVISAKIAIITSSNELKKEHYCKNASWFVRESLTLKQDNLKELPSEWRHVDGRGMVLLEKHNSLDQPKRKVLLLMLAVAYSQAFQQINEELANALKPPANLENIEELYERAAEFNARYYFFNPVKLTNYPTYNCWQDIREAYQLPVQYSELNEQIEQVHSILSHRKKQKDDIESQSRQQKNEKWYKNITLVGLLLSVLGLIEVLDTLIKRFG